MIKFKIVRFKNLLSTGNTFTEIELNNKKTTIVSGNNGAGKSTFLDALCYCLYNNAYRKINKPQLVNNITRRNLLVEVEFDIGSREYLIRRGQKPNIFEIYQDGNLLNQVSDNRDYQGMLEQNILNMNEKSFRQIVVLGSAEFVPFMKLTAQARREIIEDLLDIQVFSVMNTLLKSRINKNKDDMTDIQYKIELQNTKIQMHKKHQEELKQNYDSLISSKISSIDDYQKQRTSIISEIELFKEANDVLQLQSQTKKSYKEKYKEAVNIRQTLSNKIKKLIKEAEFYESHVSCPTCQQEITKDFIENKLLSIREKQSTIETKLSELDSIISKLEIKNREEEAIKSSIQENTNRLRELSIKADSIGKIIKQYEKDIEALRERKDTKNDSVDENELLLDKEKLSLLQQNKKDLSRQRETLGLANMLLKDGGIKTVIIKQYIPLINKTINKYLRILEFYHIFQLDENFKEIIMSTGKDMFSYFSFSEGEKMRIDLSILFAWRAIAKARNSASTNLLVLDEIFDSSMDHNGTDEFINMIHALTEDTNTFIISPKADVLIDKFENVIQFVKVKNFSKMVA